MSAQPVPLQSDNPSQKLGPNQAIIRGRVREVRRTDNGVFTVVTLPAPDEYSQPENPELISKSMIGRPGDDITVRVQIGGYGRKFERKDGTPGLATTNMLRVVE